MKLGVKIYRFYDGKMELWLTNENIFNLTKGTKLIRNWYRNNPYAKRLNENWICSDYRIDQQRPQRNVYSQTYMEIIDVTEIEKIHIDILIENLENKIDYPTVWDDGINKYYEETIYCPNCGKRRKVLTSKTHCEFCGFEFNKALKCEECGTLNLKGSKECKKCGHQFRKKSFINNKKFEVKKDNYGKIIKCPICNERKSKYFDTCQNCGYDYKNKKQCPKCDEWIKENDKYCGNCGQKQMIFIKCKKCGKKNKNSNNYCNYCGNKLEV